MGETIVRILICMIASAFLGWVSWSFWAWENHNSLMAIANGAIWLVASIKVWLIWFPTRAAARPPREGEPDA
jgi:hypothetical protein